MNNTELFEESPHGYRVTSDEPADVDEAISHYLQIFAKFARTDYPIEYGVANYGMGRVLFKDRHSSKRDEDRAKRIENSLFYFNQSLEIFNPRDYPMMYALICVYMARLYRDRSHLITSRTFLANRGTPAESLQHGVDQALEALHLYSINKAQRAEYALCCLELGHIIVLQLDMVDLCEDNGLRDQAIVYLERARALLKEVPSTVHYKLENAKPARWQPADMKSYPLHVRLLLEENPFHYLEGITLYLQGRVEEGWHFHANAPEEELELHRRSAFELYTQAVKPKVLSKLNKCWADSHHRLALLITKFPRLVDDEYDVDDRGLPLSDLHLEVALSHLTLARRCDGLERGAYMDIYFHTAQVYIAKLQGMIDKVPFGESVTRAISNSDGLDFIEQIEANLRQALNRVTAANTQSPQDGFIYYFSSLKMAEYRMLQAACHPDLDADEREQFLKDAVDYMVDATLSRPLADNMDLHYVGTLQLAQMLSAVKRSFAASKTFAKALVVLSVLCNRSIFNPTFFEDKLLGDANAIASAAVHVGCREVEWVKLHLGPMLLHERAAAGYAAWSFEALPRKAAQSEPAASFSPFSKSKRLPVSVPLGLVDVVRATPPKGVPPLPLASVNMKKVYVSGEDVAEDPNRSRPLVDPEDFPAPEGPVPLYALGHRPALASDQHSGQLHDTTSAVEVLGSEEPRVPQSPYAHRLRARVPPLGLMTEIDKSNRAAFGLPKGKVAYLMPTHAASPVREEVKPAPQPRVRKMLDRVPPEADSDGKSASRVVSQKVSKSSKPVPAATAERASDEEEDASKHDSDAESGDGAVEQGGGGDDDDDEEEVEGDDDEDVDAGATRPRSQRVKPPPPQPTATKAKRSVFSWLLGRRAATHPTSESRAPPPKRGIMSGFLPALFASKGGGRSKVVADKARKRAGPRDEAGLWASRQAFFLFMVMSRGARLDMAIRSKRLELLNSERATAVLFKTKPKYLATLYRLIHKLHRACDVILAPPSSLKEMAALSSQDLQRLFRSHAKIAKSLDDLEHFLFFKMTKVDYFIPYIGAAPALSRDLHALDAALLDARVLNTNLAYERMLSMRKVAPPVPVGGQSSVNGAAASLQSSAVSQPSHDSVSFASSHVYAQGSAGSVFTAGPQAGLSEEERRQQEEEMDETFAGKMTYALSQTLDGASHVFSDLQGSKDMLLQSLALDECLMTWHLPSVPAHKLTCVLVWREDSQSLHSHFTHAEAAEAREERAAAAASGLEGDRYVRRKTPEAPRAAASETKDPRVPKGVVMEVARSDLDASHAMQHVQRFLDAMHARPSHVRVAQCSDALQSLSCALSVTELLLLVPSTVRSLVICAPPELRLVPWHLLYYEDSMDQGSNGAPPPINVAGAQGGVQVKHLMETYRVRLGPTLSLFELSSIAARRLRHSTGLHRLCCIDGDDRSRSVFVDTSSHPLSKAALGGIRGADLEVACVATAWSADPEDSTILADESATPSHLETACMNERLDDYRRFKRQLNHLKGASNSNTAGAEEVVMRRIKQQLRSVSDKGKASKARRRGAGDDVDDDDDDSEDGREDRGRDDDEEDILAQARGISEQHRVNVQALTACRVLHIAAHKLPLLGARGTYADDVAKEKLQAAMALPRDRTDAAAVNDAIHTKRLDAQGQAQAQAAWGHMRADDWVRQVYVRNCALAVLSRFSILDDVVNLLPAVAGSTPDPAAASSSALVLESNWEFIEAVLLSGACSVLVPLWEVPALPNMLFLLRFYSFLPSRSRDRLSVVETVRRTQLWLRGVSADDAIAFVHKAPIPAGARDLIIAEIEGQVTAYNGAKFKNKQMKLRRPGAGVANPDGGDDDASVQSSATGMRGADPSVASEDDADPTTRGNREGGARRYFDHYLFWGAYAVCGYGGNVHHPDLTEAAEEANEAFGDGLWNDAELDSNILFEIEVLRREGKHEDARALERILNQRRLQRVNQGLQAVQGAGWKAGRFLVDGIDYFDKLMLDQDSDEVSSVSSDGSDGSDGPDGRSKGKRRKGKKRRAGEPGDSERGAAGAGTVAAEEELDQGVEDIADKYRFAPLDLDKRNQDVAYAEWRSKVGGLSDVKAPQLRRRGQKVQRGVHAAKVTPKKGDNYEYNMIKAMQPVAVEDEDSGNSSGEGDKRKTGRRRDDKPNLWKEVFGGVRSYGEIAKMIAEKTPDLETAPISVPTLPAREECVIA